MIHDRTDEWEERQDVQSAEIARVLMRVSELPDRSSPEDWPEAMLVTRYELESIVRSEFDPLAMEVLRLRRENHEMQGESADWQAATECMNDRCVPMASFVTRVGMVLDEAADQRLANEKLESALAAKDRDIQALRGELAILMEVVESLPEELLDKVPDAKLLRAYQAMTEADKHKHMDTVIDRQAAEIESWKKRFQLVNEALRRRMVKGIEEDGS